MEVEIAQEIDISLLKPHPRNVEIYGDNEDISDLVERIKVSKWIKPLVITQHNRIISGHSRWKAAQTLGYTKVPFEQRFFATELEELESLLLENVGRLKNMEQKLREAQTWKYIETEKSKLFQESQGDKGELGKEHGKKGGRGKKKNPLVDSSPQGGLGENEQVTSSKAKRPRAPVTRDKLAAKADVGSGRTFQRGEKALHAIDRLKEEGKTDAAEGLRKVLNEEKNVTAAAQLADCSDESLAILIKIGTGQAKNVKEAKALVKREILAEKAKSIVLPEDISLWRGDFFDKDVGGKILANSVSLIFTDPPYHEKHLDLWSHLGCFAARVLKPGGILLAYSGQIALPQVFTSLSEHLDYCWLLGQFHRGQHLDVWKYHIWNEWKPLVLFSKGKPVLHEWFIDAYDGVKGDKQAHEWAQGEDEAQYFIQKLTQPGDLVVDPMCGSGPIIRMAHRFKRRSIGIEIDKQRYDVALGSMEALAEV